MAFTYCGGIHGYREWRSCRGSRVRHSSSGVVELGEGYVGGNPGAAGKGGRRMDLNPSSWVLMLISFLSVFLSFLLLRELRIKMLEPAVLFSLKKLINEGCWV